MERNVKFNRKKCLKPSLADLRRFAGSPLILEDEVAPTLFLIVSLKFSIANYLSQ